MLRYCKSIYVLHIHTTTTAHGFVSVQASCYRRISAISSKRIGVPRLQPHNVCVQYGPRSDLHQISLRVRLDLVLSLDSGSTSGFSLEWGKRGEGRPRFASTRGRSVRLFDVFILLLLSLTMTYSLPLRQAPAAELNRPRRTKNFVAPPSSFSHPLPCPPILLWQLREEENPKQHGNKHAGAPCRAVCRLSFVYRSPPGLEVVTSAKIFFLFSFFFFLFTRDSTTAPQHMRRLHREVRSLGKRGRPGRMAA